MLTFIKQNQTSGDFLIRKSELSKNCNKKNESENRKHNKQKIYVLIKYCWSIFQVDFLKQFRIYTFF